MSSAAVIVYGLINFHSDCASYPECDEARGDERGQSIGRRGRVGKAILGQGAISIASSSLVIAEPALGYVH
tara:strand:+ start:379 stop:591 length:213 start_codon:yes stop_codon:yes gene_type:complete